VKQFQKLENVYYLLQEEKQRVEGDNKGKLDYTFHTIANLRTDIDTLKFNISQANQELQKLRAENNALKEIAENKALTIGDLKNELSGAIDLNNRLRDDIRSLENSFNVAKDDKRTLLVQIDRLEENAAELKNIVNLHEKKAQELEHEKNRREKQIIATQNVIDNLTVDLRNKTDTLILLEAQIADANKNIIALNAETKDLERLNERARNDALQQQKQHQQEVARNVEFVSKIGNLDLVVKSRDNQIQDLKIEYENLKRAHNAALETNAHINHELEIVKHNIDELTEHNDALVKELEQFSHQDQKVIQMLDRKDRVDDLKSKSGNKMNSSISAIEKVKSSPVRRRNPATSPSKLAQWS